ncbi:MAG: hypothetical protein J1F31_01220 [Erysipelotrichales bacterium]|nr:hypothetical protein [Erysipelotrichales bacterium]
MKKAKYMLPLLLSLLLTSCSPDLRQNDWHINTLELADEYFPKYFDAIESSLQINNIKYEKEYSESIERNEKRYNITYCVSNKIYYEFLFRFKLLSWKSSESLINCTFYYNVDTEEEMFSLPQGYINVMIDVNDFCTNNYLGTGEKFNTYFDKLKEKYLNGETDSLLTIKDKNYSYIATGEMLYRDLYPRRGVNLSYNDEEYDLRLYLCDYLTDINIWDK